GRDGPGGQTVVLRVSDNHGVSATSPVTIAITNVAPANVSPILSAGSIDENGSTTLSGSFTDLGSLDTHAVVINWGDGSPKITVNLAEGVLSFSGVSHQYPDNPAGQPNGSFSIAVIVTDKDGGSASGGKKVQVKDLPPTAWLAGPALGVPGQPRTFNFSANDQSPTDQAAGFTYTINWGDGSTLTIPRSAG